MQKEFGKRIASGYNACLDSPLVTRAIGVGLVAAAVLLPQHQARQEADTAVSRIEHLEQQSSDQAEMIDRLGVIAGGLSGSDLRTALGTGLDDVHELPGYTGFEVREDKKSAMQAAAVKLFSSVPDTEYWSPTCSGTYVEVDDTEYVLSARHCILDDQPLAQGIGSVQTEPETVDVRQYRVSPASRGIVPTPATGITGIAFSFDADYALLRIDDPENTLADALTPVALDEYANLPADPGEAAATYSSPVVAGGQVVPGKGVYLGLAEGLPSRWGYRFDLVGLTGVQTAEGDACNFGASGSSAILEDGRILGPLSLRNSIGYSVDSLPNYGDDIQRDIKIRLNMESQTGLDLNQFTTVCGYSRSVDTDVLAKLAAVLADPQVGAQYVPVPTK